MWGTFSVAIFNGVAICLTIDAVARKITWFSVLKESKPDRKNICRKEILERRIRKEILEKRIITE